jgi:hypothetical protein
MVAYDSGTDTYSWERIEIPVNQVDGVQSKQYNIVGMQIQKGNLPRPTSTVSITAEYIRLILTYIAQVNGVATDNASAITILNNFMSDVIAGTQDLGYDNTISGLVATTIKDAIDEIDGNVDDNTQELVDMKDGTSAFTEISLDDGLGNIETITHASKKALDDEVARLETANMIKTWSYNATNGIVTITYYDDTTSTVDLPLELIVESGYYDEDNNNLVLVLANGSEIDIPVGDLLTDLDAVNIRYNNGDSGLVAVNVKAAIDELDGKAETLDTGKVDKDFTPYTELTTDLSDDDYVIVRDVSNNQTKKTKVSTLRQFETDTYEYGVRWIEGQSSSTLERVKRVNGELFIGSATNLVANIGIDDEVVVNSFDNIGIYNRPRVSIGGNTFVQIPKYYISEYLANESGTIYHYLWVCDKKLTTYNYRLPIRFDNGDGTEKDYTYIGAYEAYVNASGVAQSVSGVLPTTSITRNNARISARKNDGDGTNTDSAYGIKDLAEHYDLLQVPFYIEFATLNSQSIFRGVVDLTFDADTVADSTVANTAIIANNANFEVDMTIYLSTGTYHTITQIDVDTPIAGQTTITFDGDTVTPLTGVNLDPRQYKTGYTDSIVATSGCYKANDGKHPIKYRGVENFNGNVWEFTDGGKISNWYLWVTENPSDYDDVSSDVNGDYALPFVKLNYQNALLNGYIIELGWDERYPFARLPKEVGGGSSTYYADNYYQNSGDRVLLVGGFWADSSNAGLTVWYAAYTLSNTNYSIGFRLSHRP